MTSSIKYHGVTSRDISDSIIYGLPCKDYEFLTTIFCGDIESILKPILNDAYYRYLSDNEPNYYLSYYNAHSSGKKLDLHIDSYIPSPGPHCWSIQVVIALEAMTAENGCTTSCSWNSQIRGVHKS